MNVVIPSASSIERKRADSVELDLVDRYLGQMGTIKYFVDYETLQHPHPA